MANLSEDIQCTGSDTRPPMLDKTDFASWQLRIRLYCRGKENGENILKLIDEGPFQMGTFRETLSEGNKGALHLGLPKEIYSLINHYTNAKDIWDNVKMLLEGSELTKEDRESQLYDDFEHFRQHKGETIHDYYAPRALTLSQSSTNPSSTYVPPYFADNSQLDSGLSPMDNLIDNVTNTLALLTQSYKTYLPQTNNQLRTSSNTKKPKPQFKTVGLWSNKADDCDAFDSDVDEAPTAQTMFMANLSSRQILFMMKPEQVELYKRRAMFELTEREQKIDEQLRIVITNRNIKEENSKKELHSIKLQLASTINHNKSMVEEVTDFKQKENKYLEEFLDIKALKEKVEDKLY
ncbi:hypothetical protein Tco_1261830, partial [Tanacetum coccineum]